jgi:xanthine dehydrogenase accessory factor
MTLAVAARHWIDALAAGSEPCVAVTVAAAEGSTPREQGAHMLVERGDVLGTIGGGHLELKATGFARDLLRTPGAAPLAVHRFALGPSLGQCCGGAATLLLERIGAPRPDWVVEAAARRRGGEVLVLATPLPASQPGPGSTPGAPAAVPGATAADGGLSEFPRLIGRRQAGCVAGVDAAPAVLRDAVRELIESSSATARLIDTARGPVLLERIAPDAFHVMLFGAGHVGQAVAAALALLPCKLTWIDDREELLPRENAAHVDVLASFAPALEVQRAAPGTFFLVMTHSHALDQEICEEVLRRDDFAYLGLIGSATKRATFERRLAQRGIARELFARLTCPIGIAGIRGKEPAVIAAAVAAQMLQIRETA